MNYERELEILENKADDFEKRMVIDNQIAEETLQSAPKGNFHCVI